MTYQDKFRKICGRGAGAPAERAQSGGRIGEPFCVVGPTETFIEEFPAQNITTTWGITIINMQ